MKIMDLIEECGLLGGCLMAAQKMEFILYGIASHLSHIPEAKEKRFRQLTPEKFLRGDPSELKATLGQMEKVFGEKLHISSSELNEFIRHRNLFAHNYYRLTKIQIAGTKNLENPEEFLRKFLEQCAYWENVLSGLLYLMLVNTAKKENRECEINLSELQKSTIAAYSAHIEKRLTSR